MKSSASKDDNGQIYAGHRVNFENKRLSDHNFGHVRPATPGSYDANGDVALSFPGSARIVTTK